MPAGDMRSYCAQRALMLDKLGACHLRQPTAHLLPLSSVALRACSAFRVAPRRRGRRSDADAACLADASSHNQAGERARYPRAA
jgi:hypothetical protein